MTGNARSRFQKYWRRQVLEELDGGRELFRTDTGWMSPRGRTFRTRTLQGLANEGLINPDFKETGRASRQRELDLDLPPAPRPTAVPFD